MPAPAPPDLIGTRVAGKYRLEALVARGGMGAIYRATQQPLGREVAVKILAPGEASADVRGIDQARFFREASVASKLTHPNTVVIHDYGALEERPGFYLVMEYLHGRTLADAIANGPMALSRVVHIASQVCGALVEAHAADVVHRDLKPQNIMLIDRAGDGDFVKVVDFGLVKLLDNEGRSEEQTDEGSVIGSPLYMAPEQIFAGEIDTRTDIYSLGVVLYNLLTGRAPFLKNPQLRGLASIMMGHTTLAPPRFKVANPDIDIEPKVEAVIMKCLSKKPEDRYGSVAELAEDLIDAATDITETARARATSTLDWNSGNDVRQQVAARMAAARSAAAGSSGLGSTDETGAFVRSDVDASPSATAPLGTTGQLMLGQAANPQTDSSSRGAGTPWLLWLLPVSTVVLVAVLLIWSPWEEDTTVGPTGTSIAGTVSGSSKTAKPVSATPAPAPTGTSTHAAAPHDADTEPTPPSTTAADAEVGVDADAGDDEAKGSPTSPAGAQDVKPTMVIVSLSSTPRANVTDLSGEVFGETPLTLEVPLAKLPFTFELRRAGYATGELRLTPEAVAGKKELNLSMALAPIAAPAPALTPDPKKSRPKKAKKKRPPTIKLTR